VPARARNILRALASFGITLVGGRSGTSHWKVTNGTVSYVIPCSNGEKTEISDVYIRGLCRAFNLDPVEFVKRL